MKPLTAKNLKIEILRRVEMGPNGHGCRSDPYVDCSGGPGNRRQSSRQLKVEPAKEIQIVFEIVILRLKHRPLLLQHEMLTEVGEAHGGQLSIIGAIRSRQRDDRNSASTQRCFKEVKAPGEAGWHASRFSEAGQNRWLVSPKPREETAMKIASIYTGDLRGHGRSVAHVSIAGRAGAA